MYAFFRGIDYIVDECPNAAGATQLAYKDMLNRLEAASPGSKLTFVQEFATQSAARADAGDDGAAADLRGLRHAVVRGAVRILPSGARNAEPARAPTRRGAGVSQEDGSELAASAPADDETPSRRAARRRGSAAHRQQGARVPAHAARRGAHPSAQRPDRGRRSHRRARGRGGSRTAAATRSSVLRPTYATLIPNLPRRAQVIYPQGRRHDSALGRHRAGLAGDRDRDRSGRADHRAVARDRSQRPAHLVRDPRRLRHDGARQRAAVLRRRAAVDGEARATRARASAERVAIDRMVIDLAEPRDRCWRRRT